MYDVSNEEFSLLTHLIIVISILENDCGRTELISKIFTFGLPSGSFITEVFSIH